MNYYPLESSENLWFYPPAKFGKDPSNAVVNVFQISIGDFMTSIEFRFNLFLHSLFHDNFYLKYF